MKKILTLSTVLLLSACGGGSDSSSVGITPPPVQPPVADPKSLKSTFEYFVDEVRFFNQNEKMYACTLNDFDENNVLQESYYSQTEDIWDGRLECGRDINTQTETTTYSYLEETDTKIRHSSVLSTYTSMPACDKSVEDTESKFLVRVEYYFDSDNNFMCDSQTADSLFAYINYEYDENKFATESYVYGTGEDGEWNTEDDIKYFTNVEKVVDDVFYRVNIDETTGKISYIVKYDNLDEQGRQTKLEWYDYAAIGAEPDAEFVLEPAMLTSLDVFEYDDENKKGVLKRYASAGPDNDWSAVEDNWLVTEEHFHW